MTVVLNNKNFHTDRSISYGSTHIESDTYLVTDQAGQKHEIQVDRFVCDPLKLNLIDVNAMKVLGRSMTGPLANPNGVTSDEVLQTNGFSDCIVATGGIYYSSTKKNWPDGVQTRQGDGLVWYKPDSSRQGRLLSEERGHFTSGGFLLIDQQGQASLQRLGDWNGHQPMNYSAYRMIVQSNVVLVHNGQEDHNSETERAARTALSIQNNGDLSIVVVHEKNTPKNGYGLTQKEFGELLVALGSREAINLDGGPSAQFAVRVPNCSKGNSQCVEQQVPDPDDMPQLFTVTK